MVDLIGDSASPYALIRSNNSRSIGTIIPDVTVEEVHHDELQITDHPVETGAAISDHAFKLPCEVQMRVGWSDSTHQSVGFVQDVYQRLLGKQFEREPFDVSTGKRHYKNMLIRSIAVTTDDKSEFALSCVVSLKEVRITSTQGGSGLSGGGGSQQFPEQTGGVDSLGTQQPAPIAASGNFDDGPQVAPIGASGGFDDGGALP